MSTIKCLPVEPWHEYSLDEGEIPSRLHKEIEPTFFKAGRFFCGKTKKCWFEVCQDGKFRAFEDSAAQFLYELSAANFVPMTKREESLARSILLFSKNEQLSKRLYLQKEWSLMQKIRREKYRRF